MSTETPLMRMARSIAAAEIGRAPAWKAAPSMIGFTAMWSPKSASAMAWASR